ncbi:hypothetical protein GGI07_001368 [Coemansia sp. Benny D115]|nr:hypothetical protein GGI07_001368 [Coemansia sp. Benny D115]
MAETSDSEPMDHIETKEHMDSVESSEPSRAHSAGDASSSMNEGAPGTTADAAASTAPKKPPIKCQACTSCRQKKIRCDGNKPTCSACLRSASECLYVPSRRRGRPARAHREYERPYANPLPILPRQTRIAPAPPSAAATEPLPPNRILPTLPHLQPLQAGQGTMPPPAPTAPVRMAATMKAPLPPILPPPAQPPQSASLQGHHKGGQAARQSQNIAPLGSILAAALFPGSPHSVSEDDAAQSGHRSSGSESPLPHNVRPPSFLVPGGERGGHQTMAQATPLVIPRPSQMASASAGSYMDPNIVEFFHYFNALFPIVHWPSFKEAYDDGTVPNYLILAIRALSKRYSKQPSVVLSGQLYAAGQDLAAIATSLAEVATREDPNTYLIQTWIILSMFELGMGRLKQAADRRELAVRLAYQLELSHIEVRASQRRARSLIVAENCRRVWWTLFYADRYFSLVSSDPEISPAIHESTYRVGFPRAMREATPPPSLLAASARDVEFPRYMDHDVVLWFQSAIPLSLLMGHLAHQCRAAEQLFRNGLAERPADRLWEDGEWLAALGEFAKSFLVIDAEITQWRQQLNAATAMSLSPVDSPEIATGGSQGSHSTRDVTLFHRELQYHGLVIIHQCLALYAYEKLRVSLSTLSSVCTSLLWLESTATQAWKKVVRSADIIRARVDARATELANARASVSGTMSNGAAPEPEWELCAPHMPFLLYLSAKVHVCQYHWQKIALARMRAEARESQARQNHFQYRQQQQQQPAQQTNGIAEPQLTPAFVRPFSQPASATDTPTSAHGGSGWGNTLPSPHHPHGHGQAMLSPATALEQHALGSAKHGAASITPVMTTSGAAALAAAQAAAQAAASNSNSSNHTTPQRSRGGSTTHLHTLGGGSDPEGMGAGPAYAQVHSEHSAGHLDASGHYLRGNNSDSEGVQMNVDGTEDDMADDITDGESGGSVESKLTRRVASSQERLELLLRLLTTCQEYWADHDYVQMLKEMLRWPDEWTTSMQMLERLLLELRID